MTEKERRRLKKKGQEPPPVQVDTTPTKIEYAVAKYLKNNVPIKKTKFLNHQVSYFNANKAIDLLLDSTWATGENALFSNRASVVEFGNKLLQKKFFHRAKKIAVTDKDLSPKELKKKQEKLKEKEKEKKKEALKKKEESEESKKEDDKTHDEGDKHDKDRRDKYKKKKTKIKLDMHLEQVFVDGSEAYVWMYDPIPFWYYIAGALLLFAAVAICLFPLWPPVVRKGVYYLSIGAAGFLGVILGLAVIRFIIFMIIWVLSMGRHHFWILPNLTEDVGFFASFWPLYHYEYKGEYYGSKKKSKKKKSGSEDEDKAETESANAKKSDDSQSAAETDKPETDVERVQDVPETVSEETDSENSNSQTFEMVNKDELSESGEEEEEEGEEEAEEEEEEEEEEEKGESDKKKD